MPKAFKYIRFSSGTQAKGSSKDRQNDLVNRWIDANPDYQLSSLSYEDLGKSGYTGAHLDHGLGKVLAAIESGAIEAGDCILVEAIDRIGRLAPLTMVPLISNIVTKGVLIVTLEDGQIYSSERLNESAGILFILVGKIQQAHEYSKNLSRRVGAAYKQKRSKARNGENIKVLTPYWLTSDGKLIQEKADIVRQYIDLYISGYSIATIGNKLVSEGVITKPINDRTVTRWLASRALIGEWSTKGENIPNVFEPIITAQEFYLLQQKRQIRRKEMSPERVYEVAGLVSCDSCNRNFHFRKKNFRGRSIIYANCSGFLKGGIETCNNSKSWPYSVLMTIFNQTKEFAIGTSVIDSLASKRAAELEGLLKEKALLSKSISNLVLLSESAEDVPEIAESISRLVENRRIIEDKILDIENMSESQFTYSDETIDDVTIGALNSQIDDINQDAVATRESLKSIGYKIVINGSTAIVKYSYDLFCSYNLIRRSTRHNCYITKAIDPEYESILHPDEIPIVVPEEFSYLAINNDGIVASNESIDGLMETLEELKS